MPLQPNLDHDAIARFCRAHGLNSLAVFGSAVRPDFHADSDLDVVIDLPDDSDATLFDLGLMAEELSRLLGRRVDLLTRKGIEQSRNRRFREAFLNNHEVLYRAA